MTLKAGWYPQDDGRERYWDGEKWTDAFRTPEGAAEPAAPTTPTATEEEPEEEPQKKSSNIGCLAWILVPVLLVMFFTFKGCGTSSGTDKYGVQVTCQDLVKNQLKNPSTAEFSDQQQSTVSASGSVTAENALGGKVTYTYRCSRSGETVRLDSLTPRN